MEPSNSVICSHCYLFVTLTVKNL